MISDYFSLAFKNLRHRGLRSWLTVIGIIIGIAAVVSLISLGAGLKTAVTGQFSTLSADQLIIQNSGTGLGPPGSTAIRKLTSQDTKIIEQVQGVELVVGRLIRIVKIEYNGIAKFQYITSIPKDSKQLKLIANGANLQIESGRFLEVGDSGKVVLGNDFSDVNLFEKQIKIGSKVIIQNETFDVVGILKKSSSFEINGVIFMPEDDMKRILNIGDEFDTIIVQVKDKNQISGVATSIGDKLRKDRNEKIGEEDFSVQTPTQSLSTINTILSIINIIIAGIAGISLVVGGIGIANIMYASVLERTKEIGVMKAIGAQNKDILFIFLIESGLLGLLGGILGALLGLGMALGISSIASNALGINFIVDISYPLLFGAIGFSFLIGIIFGLFPARQGSKLNVVEAMRK